MIWNIEEETGYKPITTFYQDFSIADSFGTYAINDTFNRVFNEWKHDYKYLTELVMVLNWKIYEYYNNNNQYAKLYDKLFRKAEKFALDNLKDEEAKYYFEITD